VPTRSARVPTKPALSRAGRTRNHCQANSEFCAGKWLKSHTPRLSGWCQGESAMTAPVVPLMLIILTLSLGTVQAETIDIVDNHGGRVDLYDHRWAGLAVGNPQVRVTGPCISAC